MNDRVDGAAGGCRQEYLAVNGDPRQMLDELKSGRTQMTLLTEIYTENPGSGQVHQSWMAAADALCGCISICTKSTAGNWIWLPALAEQIGMIVPRGIEKMDRENYYDPGTALCRSYFN